MMPKNKKRATIADQIVRVLEELADSLEAGEEPTEHFNCHKVVLDLQRTSYDHELVKNTRRTLRASQTIFARFLGVSVQAVRGWEQGKQEPSDMACRFMDEIRSNPDYWRERLRRLVKPKSVVSS